MKRLWPYAAVAFAAALMVTPSPADTIVIQLVPDSAVAHFDMGPAEVGHAMEFTPIAITIPETPELTTIKMPDSIDDATIAIPGLVYLNSLEPEITKTTLTIAGHNYTCALDTATHVYTDVGESPIPVAERHIASGRHTPRHVGGNKPWAAGKLVT